MTQEEITNGWIDNAIAYFAKLADDKESNFYVGCETDMYNGKSFHERGANGNVWNRSFYKWCAVNYQNRLVIFYKTDNMCSFYKSKFAENPPCFSLKIAECTQPTLSNKDKESLHEIYTEICAKISGMNNKIIKTLTQCEQEFEIDLDTETMFSNLPSIEESEEKKEENV